MKLNKMKFSKQYISGYSAETHSIRKYRYKIVECQETELKGKEFYSETVTPKDKYGNHQTGKTYYYATDTSKIYKSLKWLLKSMLNKPKS